MDGRLPATPRSVLASPAGTDYYCFFTECTGSTMDDARRLSRLHPNGVLVADRQTAGRGRLAGRRWDAAAGEALLMTIWFRPVPQSADSATGTVPAPLPLLVGLALVEACQAWAASQRTAFAHTMSIKWPNDILCGNHKLAGILCESAGDCRYVGIGLNCGQRHFDDSFSTKPTSLAIETGQSPDRNSLVELILVSMDTRIRRPGNWAAELNALLAWKGSPVCFVPGHDATTAAIHGRLAGIDDAGGLILETKGGYCTYVSGELKLVIDAGTKA